jgi:hypothetical protein
MGFDSGDPIVQFYFRLNDLLYRSSAVYDNGVEYSSMIERCYMDVWEPVPGTAKQHDSEKKALARAKKLMLPLEHIPLIYLAYWTPPESVAPVEEQMCVRITPGQGSYLYNIGDYMIRPVGALYALHIWDGFGAVEVGERFFSLEAATIAAVIRARKDSRERAAREAKPQTPDVETVPFIEQEPVTCGLRTQEDRTRDALSRPYPGDEWPTESDDLSPIRLDDDVDICTDRD